MTSRSTTVHAVVDAIVAFELDGAESPIEVSAAIARLVHRLDHRISEVVGANGFSALLQRSVHHSKTDAPWIELIVRDRDDAALLSRGLTAAAERYGVAAVIRGATLLSTFLLDLLASFIGEDLTQRVLRRAWPNLPGEPAPPKKEEA